MCPHSLTTVTITYPRLQHLRIIAAPFRVGAKYLLRACRDRSTLLMPTFTLTFRSPCTTIPISFGVAQLAYVRSLWTATGKTAVAAEATGRCSRVAMGGGSRAGDLRGGPSRKARKDGGTGLMSLSCHVQRPGGSSRGRQRAPAAHPPTPPPANIRTTDGVRVPHIHATTRNNITARRPLPTDQHRPTISWSQLSVDPGSSGRPRATLLLRHTIGWHLEGNQRLEGMQRRMEATRWQLEGNQRRLEGR